MKTTIIGISLILISFLILSFTSISFKPFKIQFNNWLFAIGWMAIILGILIVRYDAEQKAIKKTINEIKTTIEKVIDKKFEEI